MLHELLASRRSIRKFQDREVEKEKIDVILESVLRSPSSRGRRPWELIVVTDRGTLRELSQCRESGSLFLAGAPLGIVVTADLEATDMWVEDSSIVAVISQLMAQSLGLCSCWIQVNGRDHTKDETAGDYVKNILGIPDRIGVECIIAIGYPAEDKKPYEREELPYNKIHYNRF